jgi:hypothetical protein
MNGLPPTRCFPMHSHLPIRDRIYVHTYIHTYNIFKNCSRWTTAQRVLWDEMPAQTGRRKRPPAICQVFVDERCSEAILPFLRSTDVGRLAPPADWERDGAVRLRVARSGRRRSARSCFFFSFLLSAFSGSDWRANSQLTGGVFPPVRERGESMYAACLAPTSGRKALRNRGFEPFRRGAPVFGLRQVN